MDLTSDYWVEFFSFVVNICGWIMNVKVVDNEQCTWNLLTYYDYGCINSIDVMLELWLKYRKGWGTREKVHSSNNVSS